MRALCPRPPDEIPLNGVDITIPADYVGISAARYPTNPSNPAAPDPAPAFGYGTFRVHDSAMGRFFWSRLNTANGVYDWTHADAYLPHYNALGKSIWFTLVSTPAWAATSTANTDPYGQPGGASPPASTTSVQTFLTALLTRYPYIKYVEIWNEPRYVVGSFWEGTAAQLVTHANAVYTTVKGINSSIKVLAPGLNHPTELDQFLSAQDPVSTKFGYECIDGLAFHPYEALGTVADALNYSLDPPRVERARLGMNKVGRPSMPLYVSEYGVSGSVDATLAAFLALPAADRKARIGRTLAIYAARGCQTFILYGYGWEYCGNLQTDTTGVIAAVNEFHSACGKTFPAGSITVNRTTGAVTMTATDGISYRW